MEAKEIVIHSNDSYNATINDFLCSIRCLASSTSKTEEKNLKFRSRRDSLEKRIDRDKLGENILVVEGLLQADDILDEDKSHSLLHIFSSSLPLNESRVEFPLQISQVYVSTIYFHLLVHIKILICIFLEYLNLKLRLILSFRSGFTVVTFFFLG